MDRSPLSTRKSIGKAMELAQGVDRPWNDDSARDRPEHGRFVHKGTDLPHQQTLADSCICRPAGGNGAPSPGQTTRGGPPRRQLRPLSQGDPDWTYTPWNATGPVQIGRKLSLGIYGEFTNGTISDVRVYPTVLPPADASASGDLPKVAQLD